MMKLNVLPHLKGIATTAWQCGYAQRRRFQQVGAGYRDGRHRQDGDSGGSTALRKSNSKITFGVAWVFPGGKNQMPQIIPMVR